MIIEETWIWLPLEMKLEREPKNIDLGQWTRHQQQKYLSLNI